MSIGQRFWTAFQNMKASDVAGLKGRKMSLATFVAAALGRGLENASDEERQARLLQIKDVSMQAAQKGIYEAMASGDVDKMREAHINRIYTAIQFAPTPKAAEDMMEEMTKQIGLRIEYVEDRLEAKAKEDGLYELQKVKEAGATERTKLTIAEKKADRLAASKYKKENPDRWQAAWAASGKDVHKANEIYRQGFPSGKAKGTKDADEQALEAAIAGLSGLD